jgi:hypothetical protein
MDGERQIHLYLQIGGWDLVEHTDLPSQDMLRIMNSIMQGMPCPAPPPPKMSIKVAKGFIAYVQDSTGLMGFVLGGGGDRVQVVAPCGCFQSPSG